MFFNNSNITRLILVCGFVNLIACASKPSVVEPSSAQVQEELVYQQDKTQFEQALALINAENAQEEDLLKAKAILDSLYSANNAYLGALINSADVSFRLTKLDEAKVLYLSVLEKIEDQKTNNNTSGQALSEHINTFSLHAYNQLGLIERQQGRFEEAEHFYKQALDLNNEHPVTLKNLAILLDLYRGKLKEALALYEQYQGIVGDSDPKIKDWVFDLKNRIPQEEASNE